MESTHRKIKSPESPKSIMPKILKSNKVTKPVFKLTQMKQEEPTFGIQSFRCTPNLQSPVNPGNIISMKSRIQISRTLKKGAF